MLVVSAAGEYQAACRGKHGTPIHGSCIVMGPYPFAGIDIPGLYFTDVVRAGSYVNVGELPHY